MKMFRKLLKNEKGATAIEYGLLAAGVGVAIMLAVFTLGGSLEGMFIDVSAKLASKGK